MKARFSYALHFFIFLLPSLAMSAPNYLNIQSRISKPDNAGYLENAAVQFRITVTDPVGTCVLFQEDFSNVDMTSSKGLVNLKIGSGTKTYPVGAMPMNELFNNSGSPILNCQTGGTFTAASTDPRKVILQFNDGTGWQTVPALEVNSVPFALGSLSSQKLGAYNAADYIRRAEFTSCTGSEAVHFNGTSFTCIPLVSGGAYSSLTGATATNTIDNTNYSQTWNWSTATTQNPMSMTANSLTTGSLLNLTTSNNSLNSTDGLLNVANTGTSNNGTVARIQSNSTAGSGLTVLANGNVGIGTGSPTEPLEVVSTKPTTVFGDTGGIVANLTINPTALSSASPVGVKSNVSFAGTNTGYNIYGGKFVATETSGLGLQGIYGTLNIVQHPHNSNSTYAVGQSSQVNSSAGSFSQVDGVRSAIINSGTSLMTTAKAGNFDLTNSGGTVTNGYGVYIGDVQATNEWGLYQSDASNKNYFAGNVGIGTTTPVNKLDVPGTNTTNSIARIGELELSTYSVGNSYLSANMYFNGANWVRRAASYGGLFYFFGDEGQFSFFDTGAAGSNAGIQTPQFKISRSGEFGVGSSIDWNRGSFTGANFMLEARDESV